MGREKHQGEEKSITLPEVLSRPFRLFPTSNNFSWVSEDETIHVFLEKARQFGDEKITWFQTIKILYWFMTCSNGLCLITFDNQILTVQICRFLISLSSFNLIDTNHRNQCE